MRFEYHSEHFQNKYSEQENKQFAQQFSEITGEMFELMKAGALASDAKCQDIVSKHYKFITQFWKPNKQAYKSLAMMYVLPSDYKAFYDKYDKDFGSFTYQAISIWADNNLDD